MKGLKASKVLPLKNVEIKDELWSRYGQLVTREMIPYQWAVLNDKLQDVTPSGAIRNFRIAAGMEDGQYHGMVFQDSDVAKWLEAVAYSLVIHPDPKLEKIADEVIHLIGKAQQDDGYLDTYYIIKGLENRWTNLHECHELYCAGHMMEAAVAYYESTGKREFLEIMCRLADHIDSIFGPEDNKKKGYPGHQEIELGLVRLYKATENKKYLKLAKYFLDERGKEPYYFDIEWRERGGTSPWTSHKTSLPSENKEYNQAHLPVRDQTTAEGHSVRAVYMYASMVDMAIETGDGELMGACKTLWNNIVSRRMYITGGIGSQAHGESFSFDYDLPNDTIYAETCASIGLIFFAQRMLKADPKSCYADVMERALYNGVISGMSLDGKQFLYVNPLEVWPQACDKNHTKRHVEPVRQKWFECACCPPNLARLLTSLGQYIYTLEDDTIYTHLYIGSKTDFNMDVGKVGLTQETKYPWNGEVTITSSMEGQKKFNIKLRIPGWCKKARVQINGDVIDTAGKIQNGYICLDKIWTDGDIIKLSMDMEVELIEANPKVRANAGKVAIQRGPIVYALEEVDNGENLSAISITGDTEFVSEFREDLLGGAVMIKGKGVRKKEFESEDDLYRTLRDEKQTHEIKAIPYALWGNRESGEMQVWINYCK